MMKKDISANSNKKCLILCSKILLNVLNNFELNSFVTMATYWVPDLPNIKGISGHRLAFRFHICKWCLIYMVQQAYKYVSLGLWPTFFGLKITYMLKSRGWGLEKSELPWEQNVL